MVNYRVETDHLVLDIQGSYQHVVKYAAWFREGSDAPEKVAVYTEYRDDGVRMNIVLVVTNLTVKVTMDMVRDTDNTYTELRATHYTAARIGPRRLYEMIKAMAGDR